MHFIMQNSCSLKEAFDFKNVAKSCLIMLIKIWLNKKIHRAFFELQTPKAVVKDVFSWSYCY